MKLKTDMYKGLSYLADLIYSRRTDLNITRQQLASDIGVTYTTILYWETVYLQRLPRPDNFNALCRSLDLDPLEVMTVAGYETERQAAHAHAATRRLRLRKAA